MGSASFNKGYAFERKVAAELSMWVSLGEDKWIFNRRAGSGGSGRDLGGHSSASGDLYADKETGRALMSQISIECKFYENLQGPFIQFVESNDGKLIEFIEQAKKSAAPYNRDWVLLFKSNYKNPMVLTGSDKWLARCPRTRLSFVDGNKKTIHYYLLSWKNLLAIPYADYPLLAVKKEV